MSILINKTRIGKVTSSQCHKLMWTPKPCATYLQEIMWERKIGRSLSVEKYSRAAAWGLFLEEVVHELLPFDYETHTQATVQHPTIAWWAGSPDCTNKKESVVSDIKCFEPKNFCEYVDTLTEGIEAFKADYPKEYWQLISNAILTGMDNIEAIVYMPYLKDLPAIRERAANLDGIDQWKYKFIFDAPKEELPYLPDVCGYKDLNIFRFAAPKGDMNLLTKKIESLLFEPAVTVDKEVILPNNH